MQSSTHLDEVQYTRHMWQQFVWTTTSLYANLLSVMSSRSEVPLTLGEVAHQIWQCGENFYRLQTCVLAVEKLSKKWEKLLQEFQQQKEGPTPHWYGSASQLLTVSSLSLKREYIEDTHRGVPCGFTCGTDIMLSI